MRFSYCMVPEVYQLFWAMARGEFITDAAVEAGTYRKQGTRWLVAAGGVPIVYPSVTFRHAMTASVSGQGAPWEASIGRRRTVRARPPAAG